MADVIDRVYHQAAKYQAEAASGASAVNMMARKLATSAAADQRMAGQCEAIKWAERFRRSDGEDVAAPDPHTTLNDLVRDAVIAAHSVSETSPLMETEQKAPEDNGPRVVAPPAYRAMWVTLVALAMIWGVLAGISLAVETWLDPASAIFGLLAIAVLALTLNKMGSARD